MASVASSMSSSWRLILMSKKGGRALRSTARRRDCKDGAAGCSSGAAWLAGSSSSLPLAAATRRGPRTKRPPARCRRGDEAGPRPRPRARLRRCTGRRAAALQLDVAASAHMAAGRDEQVSMGEGENTRGRCRQPRRLRRGRHGSWGPARLGCRQDRLLCTGCGLEGPGGPALTLVGLVGAFKRSQQRWGAGQADKLPQGRRGDWGGLHRPGLWPPPTAEPDCLLIRLPAVPGLQSRPWPPSAP